VGGHAIPATVAMMATLKKTADRRGCLGRRSAMNQRPIRCMRWAWLDRGFEAPPRLGGRWSIIVDGAVGGKVKRWMWSQDETTKSNHRKLGRHRAIFGFIRNSHAFPPPFLVTCKSYSFPSSFPSPLYRNLDTQIITFSFKIIAIVPQLRVDQVIVLG
jgi:hypothetical protein